MTRAKSSKRSEVRTIAEVKSQLHHDQNVESLFRATRARFWEGWHDRFASADRRRQNGQATIADYLVLYRFLPESVLGVLEFQHCIRTKDQIVMYANLMKNYQVISEFLTCLQGDTPIPQEFSHPEKASFKSRAEFSRKALELTVELFLMCPELKAEFGLPVELWYSWEFSALKEAIEISGLASSAPGKGILWSKDSLYEWFRQGAEWLESPQFQRSDDGGQVEIAYSLPQDLVLFAGSVAKEDPAFRRSNAYREFHKAFRKLGRQKRRSGRSPMYIQDGQLMIAGRSSPRPSKKLCNEIVTKNKLVVQKLLSSI